MAASQRCYASSCRRSGSRKQAGSRVVRATETAVAGSISQPVHGCAVRRMPLFVLHVPSGESLEEALACVLTIDIALLQLTNLERPMTPGLHVAQSDSHTAKGVMEDPLHGLTRMCRRRRQSEGAYQCICPPKRSSRALVTSYNGVS